MSRAKILINDGTKDRFFNPIEYKMNYHGTKKPDTLSAKLPIQSRARKNDTVCVIQDIADVDFLTGMYNFHLTCKDESGFNHNPTADPDETRFNRLSSPTKYKGHFSLDFPDDSSNAVLYTTPAQINLSKQFDIFLWITPSLDPFTGTGLSGGKVIVWSYTDGTNGLEIGMSGTATGIGNDTNARGFVRVHDGVGTQTITGTTEQVLPEGFVRVPRLIRVYRKEDNIIRMEIQGVEDGTLSTSANLQPSGATMRFGDSLGGSEYYQGELHQVRFYRGGYLTTNDAERIRMSKPQVHTLKFKGRIWKIDEQQKTKTIHCNSTSIQVLKGKLGGTGAALTTHDLSSVAFKTIFQSIVDNVTPSGVNFTVKIAPGDTFARASLAGLIYEVGAAVDVINILTVMSSTVFYITPLDVIIVEKDTGVTTDYVFDQNNGSYKYDITNSGSSNAKQNNEVVFTGRGGIKSSGYVVPSDGTNRTLRKNILQLDNSSDLTKYVDDVTLLLAANANIPSTKHIIKSPALINHIRFNHEVDLKRNNGGVVQRLDVGLEDNLDVTEIVRQIEYNYPSGVTVINTGENVIDQYDDFVKSTSTQDGLIDTTL